MGYLMGQFLFFEINLSYKNLIEILENLHNMIEKTNDNKIKNIYRILDKSKDSVSLSITSFPETSTKIRLRHDQWIKIIECSQTNKQIIEYLESKISILKRYQRTTMY
jgi:hypothetical protein